MTLRSLKTYDGIIVRLKTIKYKEEFFCYLLFYFPNFGLQAVYFLTLFFRLYAFKTLVFLAECIYLLKLSQIPDLFYNLNP